MPVLQYEISELAGSRAAKILAITGFFFGVVFAVALGIWGVVSPDSVPGGALALSEYLTIPVIYAISTYLAVRVFCAIYNRVAARWGGLQLNVSECYTPMNPRWRTWAGPAGKENA